MERGHGGRLAAGTLRRLFGALEARWEPTISWRGADLDRILDRAHAEIVVFVVELLERRGWIVRLEVTYSEFGERGSIDLLAWHEDVATALVVEVKSELVSVEATLRKLDEKVRLARSKLAAECFGSPPAHVGRLLVLPSSTTERRRVHATGGVLDGALPDRGDAVRAWLRRPLREMRGILFVADTNPRGGRGR